MSIIRKYYSRRLQIQRISELESQKKELINRISLLEDIISKYNTENINDLPFFNDILQLLSSGSLIFNFNSKKLYLSNSLKELFESFIPEKEITVDILLNNVHSEDSSFLIELFSLPKTFKKRINGQFRLIPKVKENKEIKYFSVTGTYSKSRQEEYLLICAVRDISKDVKQVKELQRNKEKAEESDNIKTLFLYNISHNIRTPMNSIVGFAELLSMTDPGPERRKEYLRVIKKQSKNLLQLIDDVAEIAKYEIGTMTITKSKCNLNLLLQEILKDVENLRLFARKEQMIIKHILPSTEGVELYTDAGRLQQVLVNLISYLLKFTMQGSIEFGYTLPSDDKVDLFVKDTSFEISKEEQKTIFDRYSQFDAETFDQYDDETGLRLTIAKGIVKLLGGKIWVESEPGFGTTFKLSIPFEKAPILISEHFEEELSKSPQYKWSDKVILIVEDEEVNGLFLEAVFQEANTQTLYAKNGLQAIELCKSINKIDLILMDIRMPVMNGIRATQEIRKFNKTVPIIAQTALTLQEDKENCFLAGCNDAIIKPIDVEELLQMVNKYFSH
jgi:signal transduction histidine kinase